MGCCLQVINLPFWKLCSEKERAKYRILAYRRREVTEQNMTSSLPCDRLHKRVEVVSEGPEAFQELCVWGWNICAQRWNGAGALIRPWRVCAIQNLTGLMLALRYVGVCLYTELAFLLSWPIFLHSYDETFCLEAEVKGICLVVVVGFGFTRGVRGCNVKFWVCVVSPGSTITKCERLDSLVNFENKTGWLTQMFGVFFTFLATGLIIFATS